MELLDACLEKNVRLLDYEKLCDESGNYFAKLITVLMVSVHGLNYNDDRVWRREASLRSGTFRPFFIFQVKGWWPSESMLELQA